MGGKADGEIDSFCDRINVDLICIWIPLAIGGVVCGDDDQQSGEVDRRPFDLEDDWDGVAECLELNSSMTTTSWGPSEDVELAPDRALDWICVIHVLFH